MIKQARTKGGRAMGHDLSLLNSGKSARNCARYSLQPEKPQYSECRQQSMLIQAMPSSPSLSWKALCADGSAICPADLWPIKHIENRRLLLK